MNSVELSRYENKNTEKLKRLLWQVVWMLFARPTPRWCLNGWRIFLLRMFGAKVGVGCRIQGGARVWQPWTVSIGDHTWIDNEVTVYSVANVSIGSNVVLSQGAFICGAGHDIESCTFDLKPADVVIEDQVWVGARGFVMPGVRLGAGSVVAACAVVVKSVEPWMVVGGNPAQVLKHRSLTH